MKSVKVSLCLLNFTMAVYTYSKTIIDAEI